MPQLILFDVNETLLDLSPLQPEFERLFGNSLWMSQWFSLLLHNSLVVSLTDSYTDFGTLAGIALDTVAERAQATLTPSDKQQILAHMRQLPPHDDVIPNLQRLQAEGFRLATLTNSSTEILNQQMQASGLTDYFEQRLSVEAVARFKPSPQPYQMVAQQLGVPLADICMVAAHDWDIHGAIQAGCLGAYVGRNGRSYQPHYTPPTYTGANLYAITDQLLP